MRSAAAAAFFVLTLMGCAHRPVTGEAPSLTPDQFWTVQKRRKQEVSRITAKVRLTYHGRRQKVSGNGRILIQPDEKLRLELRDPIGRVHYLAVLDGKDFVAYYPRQRLAYLDEKAGGAYVLDFLGIGFDFDELHSLLLGVLPERFSGETFDTWSWDGSRKAYQGLITSDDTRIQAWVDPRFTALRRLELGTPGGRIVVDYSAFEPCCHGLSPQSVQVAHVVDLKLDRAKTALEIEWEKIDLVENLQPAESFRVELDAKAQKIPLK